MQRHLKLYRLPDAAKTEGLRKLKITDVPEACALLNKVSKRSRILDSYFSIYQITDQYSIAMPLSNSFSYFSILRSMT